MAETLPRQERQIAGQDLKMVQFGWPLGMPLVRKLDDGLWEVRSRFGNRIARFLFTVRDVRMVLLHSFIKQPQKIPASDLQLAKLRMRLLQ